MVYSLHRRDFLKMGGTAMAMAGLGTVGLTADDPSPKKRPIKKDIMYATIGYPGSVMEKFKAVKAAGFEGVEATVRLLQEEVLKSVEGTGIRHVSVSCA